MVFNLIFSLFWALCGPSPKVTRFSCGIAANKQPQGVIKTLPFECGGLKRVAQHPLAATRFLEIGRWQETSLVDSWQPTPPEKKTDDWCSMCRTLRIIFHLRFEEELSGRMGLSPLLPRPHETHEYH